MIYQKKKTHTYKIMEYTNKIWIIEEHRESTMITGRGFYYIKEIGKNDGRNSKFCTEKK